MNMINPFDVRYWIPRGSKKLLYYIGPPLSTSFDPLELKLFIARNKALGAIWDYDGDYAESGSWYRTVCDRVDYDVSIIASKNSRKKINKCLNNCVVEPIDISVLFKHAYGVYLQACTRYKNVDMVPEEKFVQDIKQKYEKNSYRAFGVFRKKKLIAYMTILDFGEYAMGDIAGFDPAYSNYYPMYGLYYYVAKYFVAEGGYKEFDRGSKPLLHETKIDEFLMKLEYRKKYCRLGVYFTLPVRIVLRLARMLRFVCRWVIPKQFCVILDSLLRAQDIADATSVEPE